MNAEEIKKAIENSRDYWEGRALENKLNIIENEEDYIKRITKIYEKANKEIDDKLAAVYTRYARNNKLTLDEAYKALPKAMEKQYKNDIMDYIEKAKSGDTKWKQYLLNQSIMHKHSVLDQLRTEYRNVVYNIDMETTGGKFLEKIYANANYYAQYSNGEENFARVDEDRIRRLLEENWSGGGNFSSTIWKNKEQLVKALDDIVITGLATGENYDIMSEKLAKRMGVATNAAKRLIMTESARMDNEGLLDYYKRTDVTHLEFIATLDMRTSDICRAMDGELIPIENAKIGLNVPPLHPYCRSVIAPVYEDEIEDGEIDREKRAYRDKDSGKTKKGNYKNYADYVGNHIGDKKQAEAIISTKNDLRNLTMAITSTLTNPVPTMEPSLQVNTESNIENNVGREPMEDEEIIKEIEQAIEDGLNLFGNGSGTNDEYLVNKLEKNGELEPKMLSSKEYEKLLKEADSIEIYRGVTIKNYDFVKDKFIGKGSLGSGLYFTSNKAIAKSFNDEGKGSMVSAIIDKNAKVIESSEVYRIGANLYTKMTGQSITDGLRKDDPLALVCKNYGLLAYYKGYDVVYNGLTDEYLILNKKILNISKK